MVKVSAEKKAVRTGFFIDGFFFGENRKNFLPEMTPRPLNFVSSVCIVKSYAQKPVLNRKNVCPRPKLELF